MPTDLASCLDTPAACPIRLVRGDAPYLELLEGEATAGTDLLVVALGGRTHNRAEKPIDGAGEDLDGLRLTLDATGLLLAGLVEPGLDTTVPILLEVDVGDNVVVSDHPGGFRFGTMGR